MVAEEFIRVLDANPQRKQYRSREILAIGGDDYIATAHSGGGEHVAVIRIGERQGLDEGLIARDKTVSRRGVDQRPRSRSALFRRGSLRIRASIHSRCMSAVHLALYQSVTAS